MESVIKNKSGKIIPLYIAREPLTPEKLRSFKGLENTSDDEATEIIFSLQSFAALVYEYCRNQQNEKENQFTNLKIAA